jgi:hypothetical protein
VWDTSLSFWKKLWKRKKDLQLILTEHLRISGNRVHFFLNSPSSTMRFNKSFNKLFSFKEIGNFGLILRNEDTLAIRYKRFSQAKIKKINLPNVVSYLIIHCIQVQVLQIYWQYTNIIIALREMLKRQIWRLGTIVFEVTVISHSYWKCEIRMRRQERVCSSFWVSDWWQLPSALSFLGGVQSNWILLW